jgi:hypothetical protein
MNKQADDERDDEDEQTVATPYETMRELVFGGAQ